MNDLLHIRLTKELRKEMQDLIDAGLFSTEGEVIREGIRDLILKYDKTLEVMKKKKK